MGKKHLHLLFPIILFCNHTYAQPSDVYYLRSQIGEPWCCFWAPYENANPLGFDAVFGAGGWTLSFYETAAAATIFNTNTCYVYMEGGDGHAYEMEYFFNTYKILIEQWVFNGGSLFMNAAPNEDNGMNYGFGGIWLWYPYWWSSDVNVHPGAITHPIWTGPFTPVLTSYYGTSYTHAYMTGGGITPIIVDTYDQSYFALAEKNWGAGHLFVGGMTTASWHYPAAEASNLRKNMHSYLAGLCNMILLPVAFTDFIATEENETVLLRWKTGSELNNDYFTVERSANGITWDKLTILPGAGNSSEINNYSVYDKSPFSGISYYKIRQTDFDGNSTCSNIEEVNFENELLLYPVPAIDHIQIQFNKFQPEEINLLNALGENLFCDQTLNNNAIDIDLSEIPAGFYYVQIKDDHTIETRKFVKR